MSFTLPSWRWTKSSSFYISEGTSCPKIGGEYVLHLPVNLRSRRKSWTIHWPFLQVKAKQLHEQSFWTKGQIRGWSAIPSPGFISDPFKGVNPKTSSHINSGLKNADFQTISPIQPNSKCTQVLNANPNRLVRNKKRIWKTVSQGTKPG